MMCAVCVVCGAAGHSSCEFEEWCVVVSCARVSRAVCAMIGMFDMCTNACPIDIWL